MKNFWLDKLAAKIDIPVPEVPDLPYCSYVNVGPPPVIELPPLVLTTPADFPTVIGGPVDIPDQIQICGDNIPPQIEINWGEPPKVECYVLICSPGTTDEEWAEFCQKHGCQP